MISFMLRRAAGAAATLLAASVIIFYLVRLVPGDPFAALYGGDFDPDAAAALRGLYGLDEPVATQFFAWLGQLLQGNLGFSLLTQTPVTDDLAERVPRTLLLLAGGVVFGVLIAVPAALLAAVSRGRAADSTVLAGTTLLLSVPQFWLGLLLIALFSVKLKWLPATGFVDFGRDPLGAVRALVLPWLTIGLGMSAFITRTLRSSLLEVLDQNYVRTARARGLGERRVLLGHALKNASIPALTVVGLEVGYLLGGSIVVEQVFSYPGMGQLIVNSITRRDYPLIQASLLFFTAGFVIVNVCVDILYAALDPRVRATAS